MINEIRIVTEINGLKELQITKEKKNGSKQ